MKSTIRKKIAKNVGPGGLWDVWNIDGNTVWRLAKKPDSFRIRTLARFGNCLPLMEDLERYRVMPIPVTSRRYSIGESSPAGAPVTGTAMTNTVIDAKEREESRK